jgi:hypothetical protein
MVMLYKLSLLWFYTTKIQYYHRVQESRKTNGSLNYRGEGILSNVKEKRIKMRSMKARHVSLIATTHTLNINIQRS